MWAIPGTALGVNSWPASLAHRVFLGWNYWWQAHLLDCLVDAEIRDSNPNRQRLARRLIRGIRLLNGGRWTNAYYDDMAWLALALQRVDTHHLHTDHRRAIGELTGELLAAWSESVGGGIPWRRGDVFKNTPANGPAAILLARTGHLERATATAEWIDAHLRDPASELIFDGLRPGPDGGTRHETTIYGYCQGVVLGADVELARRVPATSGESSRRVSRLVTAVASNLSRDGVLAGHEGGDSGLFSGILARYLALVAVALPGDDAAATATRRTASELIASSADAAWANAAFDNDLPIFGPDWSRPAIRPGRSSAIAERDLSVQLSGWMLLEAAHAVVGAAD